MWFHALLALLVFASSTTCFVVTPGHRVSRFRPLMSADGSAPLGVREAKEESEWLDVIAALRVYKEQFGDVRVPTRFAVPDSEPWPTSAHGLKLGIRVAAIRSTGKYVSGSDERRTELEDLGFEWRLRNTGAARSGDGQIEPWEVTLRALEIYQARGACESRWGGRHSLSARARALSSLDHGCAGDERELASAEKLRRAAYALLA